MSKKIKCLYCDKINNPNKSDGNYYRANQDPLSWLNVDIWVCGNCLNRIIEEWLYEHITSNGIIMYGVL